MKKLLRRLLKLCRIPCIAVLALLTLVAVCELRTELPSAPYCHAQAQDCRAGSVGLVLGCSKYIARGRLNYYFTGRIKAAAELWRAGKLRCIIVSGDNRAANYNEPRDMRNALVAEGVPEDRIVCDYAGLRTLDSVVRAKQIFGAEPLTIISQKEHVERAVAIARHHGIDAEGFEASLPPITRASRLKQGIRERAARIAMVCDFILGSQPKHLGDPVPLPE
ncbi:MAG: ElyC/SanA/YdcF family protein [Akkermansia sp.]|nr:ElyC/SanA/YdcF family protein [Akkermansia sp.]